MGTSVSDIMIHVDETLPSETLAELEREVCADDGVISACMSKNDSHLMMVTYNPDRIHSSQLLGHMTQRGLHAELVGL